MFLFASTPNASLLSSGVVVFHAGTASKNDVILTAGGRVIAVSAFASSIQDAVDLVYKGVDRISFEGKTLRRDIAHRYPHLSSVPFDIDSYAQSSEIS